jgi:hypothetical protein
LQAAEAMPNYSVGRDLIEKECDMNNPEFEDILTSLQDVVRRAYSLGRADALKQVVEVMQADEQSWKPRALMAPAKPEASANQNVVTLPERQVSAPWWARPPKAG